ncbi:unannotated protein [freshwater metagenome]|uniref:Unannotated protein n=1 Tax=freshwater metagenome TaxID=449393 RepID=A0A6J6UY70_9ZZZZ|nr:hypothetical protein [Actinomycetota bacterium]
MMKTESKNRGSLSAMVVCLVMAAISLAGLAFDGGQVVSSYMGLSDVAENAARLGGQQIIGVRDGDPHVDIDAATKAMKAYLSVRGITGVFQIRGTQVQVKVSQMISMKILGLIGISRRTVQVVRVVDVVDG